MSETYECTVGIFKIGSPKDLIMLVISYQKAIKLMETYVASVKNGFLYIY